EVGNGMSASEDRAHFSMWCMLSAPLISGNDLSAMSPETTAVLENKDVIALDKDALGVEGFVYSTNDNVEVWFKPLAGGDWAMCVLNRSQQAHNISFDWNNEKVSDNFSQRDADFAATTYSLQNLWTHQTAGTTKTILSAEISGHDVLLLRLKNVSAAIKAAVRPTIRIKAGSSRPFTDVDGNVWEADRGFADGDTTERDENLPIANTKNPALYRSERYGMTAFSLPLPNGKYTVNLYFAETYEKINAPGLRVFSFNVAGHDFKDLDLFAKTGGIGRAHVESVPVEITRGKLDITFTANVENPEINGIEVIPLP
ncbi:MAG TPA: malectin domain-containing carbohydrate-binding protein, partial [Candidatus Acidoferrum sp.]|nr:malectin domain-containing carbohydrate-binding protein [Candidatus Acidoferrum sp.]